MDSCIMSWLVEHAADVINRALVMADGSTAYERVKGRKSQGEMLEFGSPVLHRVCGKVHGAVMAERWLEGIWLGKCFQTGEHFVAIKDGSVVRARSVRERPQNIEITWKELEDVKTFPWMPTNTLREGSVIEVTRKKENPEEVEDSEDQKLSQKARVRGVKIREAILEEVGYSQGCSKCEAIRSKDWTRIPSVHHSEECRERVESRMLEIPRWRSEVERARMKKESSKESPAEGKGGPSQEEAPAQEAPVYDLAEMFEVTKISKVAQKGGYQTTDPKAIEDLVSQARVATVWTSPCTNPKKCLGEVVRAAGICAKQIEQEGKLILMYREGLQVALLLLHVVGIF